jgi:predicted transcriptional regulator
MTTDLISKAILTLGLSQLDSKVYETLLIQKNPHIASISQELGIDRRKVVASLESLAQMALIRHRQNYVRHIEVEPPSRLIHLMQQKEKEMDQITKDLSKVMPDILGKYYASKKNAAVKFYDGKDQFALFFNEILDDDSEEILHFGDAESFYNLLGEEHFNYWIRKRVNKGLKGREITYAFAGYDASKQTNTKEKRDVKFLPQKFKVPGSFAVFGERVAVWNPVLPSVVLMQDRVITDFFRNMFESVWEIL